MARETIGYVRLEWTCPNCGTRNPGPQKTCSGCGTVQPADVTFQQADRQDLLTDQKEVQKAQAGADIHCGFCGARNPAGAATCVACGGDLKEGKQRITGQVVGAYQTGAVKMVPCPNCGAPNPDTAMKCTGCGGNMAPPTAAAAQPAAGKGGKFPVWLIILGVVLCIGLALLVSGLTRRSELVGTVQDSQWERSVAVEQFGPVQKDDWKDEIPQGAKLGTCEKRYHHTQTEPVDDAEKVCGTPYTVDKGSGYGQVVQDCEYRVSLDYCQYTVDEWKVVDTVKLQGADDAPSWPQPEIGANQRAGERSEQYHIVFSSEKGEYTYDTSDPALFAQAQPGSRWTLTVNGLNALVDIEPVP